MKLRNEKPLLCAMVIALLATVIVAAAEFTGSHVFKNEFETAGVDVRIDQFNINEKKISPGEKFSYVPQVTNLKASSYVRVRFNFSSDKKDGDVISPDAFFGVKKGWIRKNDYYYLTQIIETGEKKEILEGIEIPDNWDQDAYFLKVTATVDAIQATNFEPKFEDASPWGDIEIKSKSEKGIIRGNDYKNNSFRVATHLPSQDFTYAREGTFECSTENLFSQFESFEPGDICSEFLNMKNDSDRTMEIHFKTEKRRTELLDEMKLSISCCGQEVYRGPLAAEELNSFIKIGTIPRGKAGKFEFEIRMPKSADNRFAELKDNVTWIIAVNETDMGKNQFDLVKTGEQIFLPVIIFLILTASLIIGIITILGNKSESRKKLRKG